MRSTNNENIMEVRNISVSFPIKKGSFGRVTGYIHAVEDVSFDLKRGETLGLVGESGCGKTTLLRALIRMQKPKSGAIHFYDDNETFDIVAADKPTMRLLHQKIRMVFQDPDSSLNPAMTANELIAEPLLLNKVFKDKKQINERVAELFDQVGLKREHMNRYINMFSGGQKQRIGVARALALNPTVLLADEPTSALDVSVQAQVINLLLELKKKLGLTVVFVSHDLGVIKHVSDRIAVMYLGNIVELGTRDQVMNNIMHPYAEILFSSIPHPDPEVKMKKSKIIGDVPSVVNKPTGCPFHTRCSYCQGKCIDEKPLLKDMGDGHLVACHFAGTLDLNLEQDMG